MLEPPVDELELPEAPAPELEPDAPPLEAPPVLLPAVPASPPPQSFAANCGSVGFRFAHFADLLFWPERVAAGVLVAFWFAAPEGLMCCCALSRPVDLLVLVLLVPLADREPEPPSPLVVPVLLVPVLLPLSDEPLEVPAVEPFIDELLDGVELVALELEGVLLP